MKTKRHPLITKLRRQLVTFETRVRDHEIIGDEIEDKLERIHKAMNKTFEQINAELTYLSKIRTIATEMHIDTGISSATAWERGER